MGEENDETQPYEAVVDEAWQVVRYTRNWVHYGAIVFIAACIIIAAVEGSQEP